MQPVCLSTETVAVTYGSTDHGRAILVPAGAEIFVVGSLEVPLEADNSRMVSVIWQGNTVWMFLVDLLERGTRVAGAG